MKMIVFVAFAFGAWASVALAEPPPPEDLAVAGPVALTEAEMDKIAAGRVPTDRMYLNYNYLDNTHAHHNCHRCGNYYIQGVVHHTSG